MRTEIKRMLSGRNFWAAVFLGVLGIGFGAVYPKLGGGIASGLEFSFDGKESLLFGDGLFFCPACCCAALDRFFLRRMEGRFRKRFFRGPEGWTMWK